MPDDQIPLPFKEHLRDSAELKLIQCASCKAIPQYCHVDEDFHPGKCIILECNNYDGTCGRRGSWWICCPCSQKFDRRNKAVAHFSTTKHKRKAQAQLDLPSPSIGATESCTSPLSNTNHASTGALSPSKRSYELAFDTSNTGFHPLPVGDGDGSDDAGCFIGCFDDVFAADSPTGIHGVTGNNNESVKEVMKVDKGAQTDMVSTTGALFPKFAEKPELHKDDLWLAQLLKNTPLASLEEINDSLQSCPNMQFFWVAEHAAHENEMGGGLRYLVGRAFAKTIFMSEAALPLYAEAKWHMKNFIHYVHMTDRQRARQAEIMAGLVELGAPKMLQVTRIPDHKEVRKIYGDGNDHSMYNTLPIPPVESIGGIAYVNPESVCRFAFALGLKFDNIYVDKSWVREEDSSTKKVFHVSECDAVQDMKEVVANVIRTGECEYELVVIVPANDWKDGHGVSHVKNNRPSVVSWSWTMSPTKDAVNTTDNTFAVAIGCKKSESWAKVEHRFREDTARMGDSNGVLNVYHGGLRKMVRVFVKRIASLEDKVERSETTYTLSHSGLMHRQYGHLIRFETPICKTDAVKTYLQYRQTTLPPRQICWGWSSDPNMFESHECNGIKLPACKNCRAWRVNSLLMGKLPGVNGATKISDRMPCQVCADWCVDATTSKMLSFAAHADYPRRCAENPPVPPVPGRPVPLPVTISNGEEVQVMEHLPLEFERMKMALRFAFFNGTRQLQKDRWSKAKMAAYLKSCGVNSSHIDEIYALATEVRDKDDQDSAKYYQDPGGIGSFRFPAPWMDDLPPSAYIELIMHLVFLGMAESNFELIAILNKNTKRDTSFRKNAQGLLIYLQKFRLSWLCTYPFSKANLSTGAWVSKNWLAFTRISKVVYSWCGRDNDESRREGSDDVMRAVSCFVALVARLMSHSGTSKEDVEKEIDAYIKEFLSCIRELDILA